MYLNAPRIKETVIFTLQTHAVCCMIKRLQLRVSLSFLFKHQMLFTLSAVFLVWVLSLLLLFTFSKAKLNNPIIYLLNSHCSKRKFWIIKQLGQVFSSVPRLTIYKAITHNKGALQKKKQLTYFICSGLYIFTLPLNHL